MAAARIPPELFDNILTSVKDEHDLVRDYEDRAARRRIQRYLSNFSSVCAYWANFIRPRMFQMLVLRSSQDLYSLLALLRRPCSPRIRSIGRCLQTVAVFYRFEDYFWCHDLQRLQVRDTHQKLGLRVHISGRAPSILIHGKKRCTVRRPLFNTVPRIVPFHRPLLLHVDLILKGIRFSNGAGLLNLIRDINDSGIFPRSVRCENIVWGDGPSIPLASLDPTFQLPLSQHSHTYPFDVTIMECTDNFAASFAIRSCIRRRTRGVLPLISLDIGRFLAIFLDWANLARMTNLKYHAITSRVFLSSGPLAREGNNELSEAGQMYFWRMHGTPEWPGQPKYLAEFGCHTRPVQDQGSPQMTHICSIVIGAYREQFWQFSWDKILHTALGFPMLDTIRVCVHGRDELRRFVGRHRQLLAAAESQGKLRLFSSEDIPGTEHPRQVDLSDVQDLWDLDSARDTLVTAEHNEPKSPQLQEDERESDVDTKSERAFNKAIRHHVGSLFSTTILPLTVLST